MNYKLSSQAIGAVMMALQKSLMEQTDIVPVLQGFDIQIDDAGHLVVMNPPLVKAGETVGPTTKKTSRVVTS
tara:strand:- start:345 stop:560 length:216 start_codon:yes stop_codon:yes gene_type:complete